jgi:hypothetical protein
MVEVPMVANTDGPTQAQLDVLAAHIEDLRMALDVVSRANVAANAGFDARLRALEGKK